MSTRLKIRLAYIAVILLLVIFGRGNAHAHALLLLVRVVFYAGLLGFFIYGYIARRRTTDKQDNVDVAPLTAAPIQPPPSGTSTPTA